MPRTIHALLVAIDDYPRPIPELQGCINDIDAFASYLSERVANDKGVAIKLKTLKDGEATRQAVIQAFRPRGQTYFQVYSGQPYGAITRSLRNQHKIGNRRSTLVGKYSETLTDHVRAAIGVGSISGKTNELTSIVLRGSFGRWRSWVISGDFSLIPIGPEGEIGVASPGLRGPGGYNRCRIIFRAQESASANDSWRTEAVPSHPSRVR